MERDSSRIRTNLSMQSPDAAIQRQYDDQSFNLTPAAILDVVTDVAACLGTFRRLHASLAAEMHNQILRLGHVTRFYIKGDLHEKPYIKAKGAGDPRVFGPPAVLSIRARNG